MRKPLKLQKSQRIVAGGIIACVLFALFLLSTSGNDRVASVKQWVSRRLALSKWNKAAPVETYGIEAVAKQLARVEADQYLGYSELGSLFFAASIAHPSDALKILGSVVPDTSDIPAFMQDSTNLLANKEFSSAMHDPIANFVLVCKRVWPVADAGSIVRFRPALRAAVQIIVQHTSTDAYYVIEATGANGNVATVNDKAARRRVSTLRHLQALSALRAAGFLLGDDSYLRTAAMMARKVVDMYIPWGNGGDRDGKGPFHLQIVLESDEVQPIRGLTSQQALYPLYMEPGDVPRAAIGRLAAAVSALETPIGLKTGRNAALWAWNVIPAEQVGILIGMTKHLKHELAILSRRNPSEIRTSPTPAPRAAPVDAGVNPQTLQRRSAQEELQDLLEKPFAVADGQGEDAPEDILDASEDTLPEVEDGVVLVREIADNKKGNATIGPVLTLVRHVAEIALRILPVLDALGDESASRIMMLQDPSNTAVLGDRIEWAEVRDAHALVYPEQLVPVTQASQASPEMQRMKAAAVPEAVPAWDLVSVNTGGAVFGVGVKACKLQKGKKLPAGTQCIPVTYADGGLEVIRQPAAAPCKAGDSSCSYVEHVVVPVILSKAKTGAENGADGKQKPAILRIVQAVKDTIVTRSKALLQKKQRLDLSGNGNPTSVATIMACKLLRKVMGEAKEVALQRSANAAMGKLSALNALRRISPLFRSSALPTLEDALLVLMTSSLESGDAASNIPPFLDQVKWVDDVTRRRIGKALDALLFHPEPGTLLSGDEAQAVAAPASSPAAAAAALDASAATPESDFFAAAFGDQLNKALDIDESVNNQAVAPQPNALALPAEQQEEVGNSLTADDMAVSSSLSSWRARVCKPSLQWFLSDPPWFAACCGDEQVAFTCATAAGTVIEVPCHRVMDGVCDCEVDGADEIGATVCHNGPFFCENGAKTVKKGDLISQPGAAAVRVSFTEWRAMTASERRSRGYIPMAVVGDGIIDCIQGEDENDGLHA